MPAILTRHLPILLGLACISLTSTAWSATCSKPNVKGYQYVGCLKDGLAGVGKDTSQGIKTGFVDAQGKLVIPTIYETMNTVDDSPEKLVPEFAEGIAAVNKNMPTGTKYGYIDKTGKTVIDFNYEYAGNFSNGLAPVRQNNKIMYINHAGKTVFTVPYDDAASFSEGLAVVAKQGKFGYIDTKGKLVIPIQFNFTEEDSMDGYEFNHGKAKLYKNGKPFCINTSGKTVACR